MLGTPKKDSDEILVFEYKRKIPMENEELKKGSQYFEDRNIDSSRTVSIYVEARFVDSELRSFDMSMHWKIGIEIAIPEILFFVLFAAISN